MTAFIWNLLLAIIWGAMTGRFTAFNLVSGFVLGYIILFFAQPVVGRSTYFAKVPRAIGFGLFFLWELVQANLRVAYDVATPQYRMRPGVIGIPLDVQSDAEITALANLITMTPGTLSLDVSPDRRILYIHAMYLGDPDRVRAQIKSGFERRVIELLR